MRILKLSKAVKRSGCDADVTKNSIRLRILKLWEALNYYPIRGSHKKFDPVADTETQTRDRLAHMITSHKKFDPVADTETHLYFKQPEDAMSHKKFDPVADTETDCGGF